jgi:hypothetical protein
MQNIIRRVLRVIIAATTTQNIMIIVDLLPEYSLLETKKFALRG